MRFAHVYNFYHFCSRYHTEGIFSDRIKFAHLITTSVELLLHKHEAFLVLRFSSKGKLSRRKLPYYTATYEETELQW